MPIASNLRDMTHSEPAQHDRILRISASLFAEKGFRAVGVAEIGDRAGLGRGALYYHIGSKEKLLYDIVISYISDLVATGAEIVEGAGTPPEHIRQLSRHMLKVISENLSEMTVCFRESDCLTGDRHSAAMRLHAEYQSLWVKVFDQGFQQGIFRRLPSVATKGLLGMYFHSFLWLNPKGNASAMDIADVFSDIVLRTLSPDAPACAATGSCT